MQIQSKIWWRFSVVSGIVVLPCSLFLVFGPDLGTWNRVLEVGASLFIFFVGGFGALFAVFVKFGMVQLSYSEADRKTWHYKLSRYVAQKEFEKMRYVFSQRYFESVDLGELAPTNPTSPPPPSSPTI